MAVTKLQFRGNPLALLLPMVLLSLGHSLINSVPFQTVQGCTKKQYFDISRMICRPCGAKQQKSKDGTSCVCLPGYKLISNKGGPFIRCAKCPALQSAVTQDGWSCIRCPQGVILDNERKCRCPMGNIMVERHINGALLTQVQCQPCSTSRPSFTMPDLSAKQTPEPQEPQRKKKKTDKRKDEDNLHVFHLDLGGIPSVARGRYPPDPYHCTPR